MSNFGTKRQKAITRCTKGAVGPPCRNNLQLPLLVKTSLAGSRLQVLSCWPSLKPSLAKFPILNKVAIRNSGKSKIAAPVRPKLQFNSKYGTVRSSGHERNEYPKILLTHFMAVYACNAVPKIPYHKDQRLFKCRQLQHFDDFDDLVEYLTFGIGCGEFVVLVSVILPLASFKSLLFSYMLGVLREDEDIVSLPRGSDWSDTEFF